MRSAAGKLAGFFLVKTLGKLEAFRRVVATGMQGADRARKFSHLQKELRRKRPHPVARDLAFADPSPQRVPPEGATLPDQRKQGFNETLAGCCHGGPRLSGN